MTREVRRYYVRAPREAWLQASEPRERTTRRAAAEDFLQMIETYLRRRQSAGTVYEDAAAWAAWAARIIPGNLRAGNAPDGSEWVVVTKMEYV